MSIYVDTSALIAVLDAADRHHQAAATTWTALVSGNEPLLASNYVLLETAAIVQRRSGLASLRVLERGICLQHLRYTAEAQRTRRKQWESISSQRPSLVRQ